MADDANVLDEPEQRHHLRPASFRWVTVVRLVRDIRLTETALGDGLKRMYSSELPAMRKLRPVGASSPKEVDR